MKEKNAIESLEELGLLGALNDSGVTSENYKDFLGNPMTYKIDYAHQWHKFTRNDPPPIDEILVVHERKAHVYYISSNAILECMKDGSRIMLRDLIHDIITHVKFDEMKDFEWRLL